MGEDREMTSTLDGAKSDVVSMNRILGNEGILDAYGHVSVRHPEDPQRFLLSRARSPENVEIDDVLEFDLNGDAIDAPPGVALYIERYIHAALYEARPEVNAVCHNHTLSILPFSISTSTKLSRTINASKLFGEGVPIWDIADQFGTATDLLVRNMDHGRSLARAVAGGDLALMRGHGSAVVTARPRDIVNACLSMDRGAKAQLSVLALGGGLRPFTDVELVPHDGLPGGLRGDNRAWEYFVRRAGISDRT
jgi:ribulose-5-phosphate 4-epimerase/fuculose-1-phosphate aldolase